MFGSGLTYPDEDEDDWTNPFDDPEEEEDDEMGFGIEEGV